MAVETYAQAKAANQLNDAAIQFFLTMISGQNKDGTAFTLPTTATATVAAPPKAGTSAVTSVNDTASSTTLLAANADREGATVHNDSTSSLYLKLGATASATSFTIKLAPGGYYELPGPSIYSGIIDGIWDADASGAARITELTA